MSREEERQFIAEGTRMVEDVTGQRPVGYNCNWLRRGPNTLSLLRELGYTYHIDDISRDEPFIEQVDGKDFVVVPYTLRNKDILLIEGRNYSPQKFLEQIKLDFDQLYDEAGTRRRMMSISAHDRISGSPQMVRVWDEFLSQPRAKQVYRSCARTISRSSPPAVRSLCERAKPFDRAATYDQGKRPHLSFGMGVGRRSGEGSETVFRGVCANRTLPRVPDYTSK